MRIVFFCLILAVYLATFVILYAPNITEDGIEGVVSSQEDIVVSDTPIELLFVGDIMLGRDVETRMQNNGVLFPFMNVSEILEAPDITVGNFEGIVTRDHVHTPPMNLQFSIRNEYLTLLSEVGFDVLSFANNHSGDYGESALLYTREICSTLLIICGGSSTQLDTHNIAVKEVGSKKIGFLFLQTLLTKPDNETLTILLDELRTKTDVQIAYVHWGEEYELIHNDAQQKLAEYLIDFGIDAVVGHHPHVVQDVAVYKNKPIFYSLGNFVFDQYFSNDVQEGLGINMEIEGDRISYTLIPFSSLETRNQPVRMSSTDSKVLFSRILKNVKNNSEVEMEEGILTFLNK